MTSPIDKIEEALLWYAKDDEATMVSPRYHKAKKALVELQRLRDGVPKDLTGALELKEVPEYGNGYTIDDYDRFLGAAKALNDFVGGGDE